MYERSLRNNEQENRQHFRSSNFSLAASAIQNSQQIRQLSEPKFFFKKNLLIIYFSLIEQFHRLTALSRFLVWLVPLGIKPFR